VVGDAVDDDEAVEQFSPSGQVDVDVEVVVKEVVEEVDAWATVMENAPELASLPESPPYAAETITGVELPVGVNETEHAPEVSVQDGEENSPAPLLDHVTVPVGDGPVTVAVHMTAEPAATWDGEQETEVVVVPSDTTLTMFEMTLVTKTSPFALSYARPWGSEPTETVATTVLDESDITVTASPAPSTAKTSPVPLSYATWMGPEPPGIVATTLLDESDITVTLSSA